MKTKEIISVPNITKVDNEKYFYFKRQAISCILSFK